MKKLRPLAILSIFFALAFNNYSVEAAPKSSLVGLLSVTLMAVQQAGGNWVNRYSANVTGQDVHIGYDTAPLDNKRTLTTGPYSNGSFVSEVDGNGNEEWSKYFPNSYFNHLIQTSKGDFFLAGRRFQETDNGTLFVPLVSKFDIDREDNEDDPYSFYWAKNIAFSFYSEVHDLTEGDDGSVLIAGTAYGAFTDNASFTFSPRMFVFKYDEDGDVLWGDVLSTPNLWDEANSVVHDKNSTFSISGYSAYSTGGGDFVPALSLTKMNDSGAEPAVNFTKLFVVGHEVNNVSLPDPLKGLIGLKHIQTSTGHYVFTGIILTVDNVTGNETYQLFGAKTTDEGRPLWFRQVEAPYKSAGFGVAEAKDGDYIFAGFYAISEEEQDVFLLKLREENGQLSRARTFEHEDYNISVAFSINVTENGNIMIVGGIAQNNNGTVDMSYLLGLWDKDMDDCRNKIEPNVTLVPIILGRDFGVNEMISPLLYTFANDPGLDIQDRYFVEKDRLCGDDDDDDYLWGMNEREYGWLITAFVVVVVGLALGCHDID